jgi:hypothetical protein
MDNFNRDARRKAAFDEARDRVGTIAQVLARHGLKVRGQSVQCPAPEHDDRNPSASIYVGSDGVERLLCHVCGFREDSIGVARALRETVEIRLSSLRHRPARPAVAAVFTEDQVRRLIQRPEFAFEWEAAKLLSRCEPLVMQRDLLSSWDYLSERGDVSRIVALASACRENPGTVRHLSSVGDGDSRSTQEVARAA